MKCEKYVEISLLYGMYKLYNYIFLNNANYLKRHVHSTTLLYGKSWVDKYSLFA